MDSAAGVLGQPCTHGGPLGAERDDAVIGGSRHTATGGTNNQETDASLATAEQSEPQYKGSPILIYITEKRERI